MYIIYYPRDSESLKTHRIVLSVCDECVRKGKTVPKRNPITVNRILFWLNHLHMCLCLIFFVSLSLTVFWKGLFLFNQIEESTHRFYSVFNMKKCTRCIQSINVRSRLILLSAKSGITMHNSVLVLRGFFHMFLTLRFQYYLYLVFFVGWISLSHP